MADKLHQPLHLHINGHDVPSKSNKTFTVSNPMTGASLYECASANVDDYEEAIQHANTAFKTWSKTTPSQRRLIFLRAADILTSYLDDASEILSNEVSAVPSYVKLNILGGAAILRDTAGLVTHIKGEIIPADRPGTTILVKREPMGVIFAISPWNAPVNLTARAIASPLICGNTVILKPSENSPKSQHLMVRALVEAGLPAGCLNYLPTDPADAPAVTEYTVKHKLVRKVNFTGSDRVGKIIAGYAASCLKTALLELGGKAPAVVLEDADLEDAVNAIMFGTLMNSGQICMSTERVIVHEKVANEFVTLLSKRFSEIKVGNHHEDPSVTLSGLFCAAAPKRILAMIDSAVSAGADLVYGDQKISGPNNTIIRPHIIDKVTPSMQIFQNESFGPILCICRVKSEEEAIDMANDTEYTLCASIFTKDVLRGMEVASQIRAGSCHVNGPTIYIEPPLPNGGVGGRSGYGRFGGMSGVEEFTERKIVTLVKPGMSYAL